MARWPTTTAAGAIAQALAEPLGLDRLGTLRNQTVDALNATLKASGTQTQRAYLDNTVLAHTQARSVGTSLLNDLASIQGTDGPAQLQAALVLAGMQDRATLASFDVFGRTFTSFGDAGRDHWANACCSLLVGPNVGSGVIGGLMPIN